MRSIWLLGGAVFVLALLFSIWRNDFPACYHPDEPEKVTQVLSGERNFRHPPLMLDAAALVLHLVRNDHQNATPDDTTRVGRWLSAFYMAAACAVFTWLAGFYGGTLAAVFAGLLLALNKQAALAGHFFKEDPLFALGLSLVLLAGAYRWRNRDSWVSLIVLGAAAGLAAATKYLGVVTLIYAVALELAICRTPGVSNFARRVLILLLAAFALMFLFSVSSGWNHFPAVIRAIVEAGQTARVGNVGVGAKIPHARYLGMFFLEPPLALIGLAFLAWSLVRNARPIAECADRWLLFSAPFVLLFVFSFSAITAVRYFLPISLLLACLSGCGLALGTQEIGDWARQRWTLPSSVTTCAAVILCVLGQLPPLFLL
jgi:4-amino-4-deoxy-L-arabinose transferase-like glycosyltransferase